MGKAAFSKVVDSLLKDGAFVLWCLCPTDELAEKWNHWQTEHPDCLEELTQAKAIVTSIELNRVRLDAAEVDASFCRLSHSLKRRRQQRVIRLWISSAAAVVLLCVSTLWFLDRDTAGNYVADQSFRLEIERTQKEIELKTALQGTIEIDNKATIYHRSQGTIEVAGVEKTTVAPEEEQETALLENVESKPSDSEQQRINVLKVPIGRRASLVLADGTEVWVNSETVLSFPSVFDSNHRTITVNGEVYLKVKKDESRPFIVKTSEMEVKVLGTAFNLSAYGRDHSQSVVLAEGSVELTTQCGNVCRMIPGEMVVVDSTNVKRTNVDVYKYTSWKDGVLYFEYATMAEVLQRLSHYYRVDFDAAKELSDYRCSGKLVLFNSIDSVMTTLKDNFPLSYKIKGDTIKLSTNTKNELPM